MRDTCQRMVTYLGFALFFFLLMVGVYAQQVEPKTELPSILPRDESGKFEIAVHYSLWSLDVIKGAFEGELEKKLGKELRKEVTKIIERDYNPRVVALSSGEDQLMFDSGGYNYGLELRYYPRGRDGSFSLGLAIDKAKMRLTEEGNVRQVYEDGTFAEAEGMGEIVLNPWFTTLNLRWDIKPDWMVTPFFVVGLGVAALNGEVKYDASGTYNSTRGTYSVEVAEKKTVKEAEEDTSENIPSILPLFQLNLGVQVEVMSFLNLKAEAGFWDGFILRLGVSGRF